MRASRSWFHFKGPVHLAVEEVEMCRVDPCLCPWPDVFHPSHRGGRSPSPFPAPCSDRALWSRYPQRDGLSGIPDLLHCCCFLGQKGTVPLVLPGHMFLPCPASPRPTALLLQRKLIPFHGAGVRQEVPWFFSSCLCQYPEWESESWCLRLGFGSR